MTADEFIRVASITLDEVRKAREQGADRERRRIRRALMPLLARLKRVSSSALNETDSIFWFTSAKELDAATRAKKGKRK